MEEGRERVRDKSNYGYRHDKFLKFAVYLLVSQQRITKYDELSKFSPSSSIERYR